MKTITIDLADNVYNKVIDYLKLLPVNSIKIYEYDPDALTVEEEKEAYLILQKIKDNDLNEFEDWDSVKSQL